MLGWRTIGAFGAITALGVGSGCGIEDCPAIINPTVRLQVEDSLSGIAIADSATAVLRQDGQTFPFEYLDSNENPARTLITLEGSEGPAVVEVQRPGYEGWRREGVSLDFGPCTARTTDLTARLQRRME